MRRFASCLLGLVAVVPFWACSSSNKDGSSGTGVDIPDDFDAAFVTGTVCMPSQIGTGNAGDTQVPQYPLKFATCLYRCVSIDPGTQTVTVAWSGGGGAYQMVLLATVHLRRVTSESNCDGTKLPSPPTNECTNTSFEWMVGVPYTGSESSPTFLSGAFQVAVPYMSLEEGETLLSRVKGGEPPSQAVLEVLGPQNYPSRQFTVQVDPSFAQLASASDLSSSDCHTMAAP
jgi:hypothetical protein